MYRSAIIAGLMICAVQQASAAGLSNLVDASLICSSITTLMPKEQASFNEALGMAHLRTAALELGSEGQATMGAMFERMAQVKVQTYELLTTTGKTATDFYAELNCGGIINMEIYN